ncbi:FAD-binding oxidoreductase [Corallincola holothuriorum]|uniref:D-2-hydroxyglutarate dehydrogenase n=1 Tax=Corallincola holothuriorum TaxID=2282215 RepID=A0A368NKB9_9GAMM|nr:FAD-binding and (Fe-S)-binding domain-containing protein [Corallincola holothuriorum]RCU50550.1 FAD-binding oxidoreductase [Corallincola holothuriorum]
MIPKIGHQHLLAPECLAYLQALEQAGFEGDIEKQYGSRLAVATDNSVYQQLPQGVLFPKHHQDVQLMTALANEKRFQAITFSARGGGTGTNGQSLTPGLVVDLSRHMNRVLEVNAEEGWVRVETGVVKDQLNDALRPHGLFFSPDLSTSNRATVGGMINTDASGQGSLVYGKTSDHILGLRSVLVDGTEIDTLPIPLAEAETLAAGEGTVAKLYRQILASCRDKRQAVLDKFPPLNRFLTGYDLKHALNDDQTEVDASRLLAGSEGSLAIITEAKLNTTVIPKHRALVNVKYDSFESALRNAPVMVKADALSVETIDSRVLNLAKEDIVWHSVKELITDVPGKELLGINIVEFADHSADDQQAKLQALRVQLDKLIADEQGGVIGYQVTEDLASINRIYGMRKKAVGLLGAAKGRKKPIAFAEDTCVPPENLADFIMEFRQLLDDHQLNYGMFGHVDAGVLHVRPALDMCDPEQEVLLRKISDQVVALTAKYGGLMWGEHGKGYRSEYSPAFFGDELWGELRKIKSAFDPFNRLNPGKICTPFESDAQLVSVDATKRGFYDRQIPVKVRDSFTQTVDCNGNGLCFNYDLTSPMCPSMKITKDRRHSPKGRAGLVREWLRLAENEGVDVLALEQQTQRGGLSIKHLVDKVGNTWRKSQGEYDYAHEVMEAMKGCLACKACTSQCPIKVDVPTFRARFMNLYHTRYLRPARDYLVANIEKALPLMAKFPGFINFFLKQAWVKFLTKKTVGFVDAPLISTPTLKQSMHGHAALGYELSDLQAIPEAQRGEYLLVVQDPFTTYYDADVVRDLLLLIEKLGYKPVLLPFKPNGKPQHVKGFLTAFAKTAKDSAEFLQQVYELGMPMVGVDPSLVMTYRDEYVHALGEARGDFEVMLFQEWFLKTQPEPPKPTVELSKQPAYKLFGHCTEKTALPTSDSDWQKIFELFGIPLANQPVGCCGMAGTYGHEAPNYDNSKGIYELSWQDPIKDNPTEAVLATGYSCRSQVKRFDGFKPKHPVQALLALYQ